MTQALEIKSVKNETILRSLIVCLMRKGIIIQSDLDLMEKEALADAVKEMKTIEITKGLEGLVS